MRDVGLSCRRSAGANEAVTQQHIETGLVPGAVMMTGRAPGRKLALWYKTIGASGPRREGFPIAGRFVFESIPWTKTIVSVAAMMWFEEGRMQIRDTRFEISAEDGAQ